MLKIVFTSDYEIHGNGDGCSRELMIEPTNRMMNLFEEYGAKLTIMADIAEILKFKEHKDTTGFDDYHYDAIAAQLRDAIQRGHDVQLHLHASYFKARYKNGRWLQNWSEYDFAALPPERLDEVVRIGKEFLEDLLQPISARYECIAFRAANWSMSPSRNVIRALLNNGIRIDTSVFKYGQRNGIVGFDYTAAHSDLVPWLAAEDDICRSDADGKLLEIPIYCERRWLGAFLSVNRIFRAQQSHKHKFKDAANAPISGQQKEDKSRRILNTVGMAFRRHPWKADFNQCSGRQLIGALKRAEAKHGDNTNELPFVLIGHSKLFNRYNEKSLRPFLEFIAQRPGRFGFGTFIDSKWSAVGLSRVKAASLTTV